MQHTSEKLCIGCCKSYCYNQVLARRVTLPLQKPLDKNTSKMIIRLLNPYIMSKVCAYAPADGEKLIFVFCQSEPLLSVYWLVKYITFCRRQKTTIICVDQVSRHMPYLPVDLLLASAFSHSTPYQCKQLCVYKLPQWWQCTESVSHRLWTPASQ